VFKVFLSKPLGAKKTHTEARIGYWLGMLGGTEIVFGLVGQWLVGMSAGVCTRFN